MNRSSILPLFLFFVLSLTRVTAQDTLLIFHPTVNNLEVIRQLMEEEILELDDMHLLGIYHHQEVYDYWQSVQFLEAHPELPFSIRSFPCGLQTGTVFARNECSEAFNSLFQNSAGALFMGGPDLPPVLYNEPVHLLTVVTDPYRHFFEASFLFHLLGGKQDSGWKALMEGKKEYLISGICLGMQTLNVSTGGTLIQDIPTELYQSWLAEQVLALPTDQQHRNYADKINAGCPEPTSYHFHPIRLIENTFITENTGMDPAATPWVLSSHHQSVEQLGKGWQVAATSMDGKVVEAIEHKVFPHVFGVQFHPEKPGLFDPAIKHPQNCSGEISFMETIENTDSYEFHLAYWNYIGKILRKVTGR
jgi:putative glutamine amidotransferase